MLTDSEATSIEDMGWSDAVHLIEGVVNEKIKTFESEAWRQRDVDRAMKIALAWHRILRG